MVGECNKWDGRSNVEVTGIKTIPAFNETALIDELNNGPVIASLDAKSTIFVHYHTGILNSRLCKQSENNHWVLIVGYGSIGDSDYYLIRNSWGKEWGLVNQTFAEGASAGGYAYIARSGDDDGICGI